MGYNESEYVSHHAVHLVQLILMFTALITFELHFYLRRAEDRNWWDGLSLLSMSPHLLHSASALDMQ